MASPPGGTASGAQPLTRRGLLVELTLEVFPVHEHENCRELFADLSAYIDEDLDEERCRELSRHLNQCEACKRYLSSLVATRDALKRTGEDPAIGGEDAQQLLDECLESIRKRCLSGDPNR